MLQFWLQGPSAGTSHQKAAGTLFTRHLATRYSSCRDSGTFLMWCCCCSGNSEPEDTFSPSLSPRYGVTTSGYSHAAVTSLGCASKGQRKTRSKPPLETHLVDTRRRTPRPTRNLPWAPVAVELAGLTNDPFSSPFIKALRTVYFSLTKSIVGYLTLMLFRMACDDTPFRESNSFTASFTITNVGGWWAATLLDDAEPTESRRTAETHVEAHAHLAD